MAHKMKKLGCLVALAVIVIIFILGLTGFMYLKNSRPPSIEDAPYGVQCYYEEKDSTGNVTMMIPTRYYYAEHPVIEDGNAILKKNEYWSYDGQLYHKENKEKVIPEPYMITRRKQ